MELQVQLQVQKTLRKTPSLNQNINALGLLTVGFLHEGSFTLLLHIKWRVVVFHQHPTLLLHIKWRVVVCHQHPTLLLHIKWRAVVLREILQKFAVSYLPIFNTLYCLAWSKGSFLMVAEKRLVTSGY